MSLSENACLNKEHITDGAEPKTITIRSFEFFRNGADVILEPESTMTGKPKIPCYLAHPTQLFKLWTMEDFHL